MKKSIRRSIICVKGGGESEKDKKVNRFNVESNLLSFGTTAEDTSIYDRAKAASNEFEAAAFIFL